MGALRRRGRLTPAAVTGAYVVAGLAWIVATDALAAATGGGAVTFGVQTAKGVAFVLGTGGLLFWLLYRREATIVDAHETIDDARRRFESIVHAAPVPIVALDAEGRVETWNPAAEETFGWSAEAVEGERLPIVPKEGREEFQSLFDRVADGDSIDGREIHRQTAEGAERVLSLSAAPISEDGSDGVMAVFRDVTERRAREESLAAYRDLVDHLPVGVFRTAPRDRDEFVEVNPALVEMFGADSAADLLGTPVSAVYADADARSGFHDDLEEVEVVTEELRLRRLDGEVFWGRTTAIRRVDDDGRVYVEGIVQDVSDRKERDRQLAVLDRVLRHNLRNKMGVVLGRAEDVERLADGEAAAAGRRIRREGRALLDVVGDQREIVELVAESPDPTTCDLRRIVDRQLAAARERHPEAEFAVTCPDAVEARAVSSFGRALRELIDNAVEHADEEAPHVRISVTADDDRVTVAVADEGPGIPEAEVGVLTQERDIGPLYHGTGMGLWLVRWIVRFSEGTLRFEEKEPSGTVVTIELDRA